MSSIFSIDRLLRRSPLIQRVLMHGQIPTWLQRATRQTEAYSLADLQSSADPAHPFEPQWTEAVNTRYGLTNQRQPQRGQPTAQRVMQTPVSARPNHFAPPPVYNHLSASPAPVASSRQVGIQHYAQQQSRLQPSRVITQLRSATHSADLSHQPPVSTFGRIQAPQSTVAPPPPTPLSRSISAVERMQTLQNKAQGMQHTYPPTATPAQRPIMPAMEQRSHQPVAASLQRQTTPQIYANTQTHAPAAVSAPVAAQTYPSSTQPHLNQPTNPVTTTISRAPVTSTYPSPAQLHPNQPTNSQTPEETTQRATINAQAATPSQSTVSPETALRGSIDRAIVALHNPNRRPSNKTVVDDLSILQRITTQHRAMEAAGIAYKEVPTPEYLVKREKKVSDSDLPVHKRPEGVQVDHIHVPPPRRRRPGEDSSVETSAENAIQPKPAAATPAPAQRMPLEAALNLASEPADQQHANADELDMAIEPPAPATPMLQVRPTSDTAVQLASANTKSAIHSDSSIELVLPRRSRLDAALATVESAPKPHVESDPKAVAPLSNIAPISADISTGLSSSPAVTQRQPLSDHIIDSLSPETPTLSVPEVVYADVVGGESAENVSKHPKYLPSNPITSKLETLKPASQTMIAQRQLQPQSADSTRTGTPHKLATSAPIVAQKKAHPTATSAHEHLQHNHPTTRHAAIKTDASTIIARSIAANQSIDRSVTSPAADANQLNQKTIPALPETLNSLTRRDAIGQNIVRPVMNSAADVTQLNRKATPAQPKTLSTLEGHATETVQHATTEPLAKQAVFAPAMPPTSATNAVPSVSRAYQHQTIASPDSQIPNSQATTRSLPQHAIET
ncbi:MAG: hypothetical protein ACPG8W_23460, partial [Candidatus Promineifilaceae bacterium]